MAQPEEIHGLPACARVTECGPEQPSGLFWPHGSRSLQSQRVQSFGRGRPVLRTVFAPASTNQTIREGAKALSGFGTGTQFEQQLALQHRLTHGRV